MEINENKKRKIKPLVIILIILIIAVAVLKIISMVINVFPLSEKPVLPDEIYGLSGKIIVIQDNVLTVEALILLKDAAKEPIKQDVGVVIDDKTKIFKLEFPKPDQLPKNTKSINPKATMIRLSDLKVGDKINVQTAANISDNIKNHTEFTAKNITVVE